MNRIASIVVVAGLTASAGAQLAGFEPPAYVGSPAGTPLTGQNGWYLPAGVGANVHTYAGNVYGISANPTGGEQFAVTRSQGGANVARGQIDTSFAGGRVWTVSYDFCPAYDGTTISAPNLSSFSLNDPTLTAGQFKQFIALNNWMDNSNPSLGWKAEYNVATATGAALNNQSPGPEWTNLVYNRWYRQSTTFDLAANVILSVSITDLTTNTSATTSPAGWYMIGGENSTLPDPRSVRMFGGGAAGNIMGWDNISVIPAPGAASLVLGLACAWTRRRR